MQSLTLRVVAICPASPAVCSAGQAGAEPQCPGLCLAAPGRVLDAGPNSGTNGAIPSPRCPKTVGWRGRPAGSAFHACVGIGFDVTGSLPGRCTGGDGGGDFHRAGPSCPGPLRPPDDGFPGGAQPAGGGPGGGQGREAGLLARLRVCRPGPPRAGPARVAVPHRQRFQTRDRGGRPALVERGKLRLDDRVFEVLQLRRRGVRESTSTNAGNR